jgi:hypothetical protein
MLSLLELALCHRLKEFQEAQSVSQVERVKPKQGKRLCVISQEVVVVFIIYGELHNFHCTERYIVNSINHQDKIEPSYKCLLPTIPTLTLSSFDLCFLS